MFVFMVPTHKKNLTQLQMASYMRNWQEERSDKSKDVKFSLFFNKVNDLHNEERFVTLSSDLQGWNEMLMARK